jgi:hypothetical protein
MCHPIHQTLLMQGKPRAAPGRGGDGPGIEAGDDPAAHDGDGPGTEAGDDRAGRAASPQAKALIRWVVKQPAQREDLADSGSRDAYAPTTQ